MTIKRFSSYVKEDLGSPEKFFVGKNLDNKVAIAKAQKRATKDHRGTHYDRLSGIVTLT